MEDRLAYGNGKSAKWKTGGALGGGILGLGMLACVGCCLAPLTGILAAGGIGLTVAGISKSLPWIFAAGFVAIGAALYRAKRSKALKSHPAEDLKSLARIVGTREATVLDANGSASFAEGHIPGALDFEALSANLPAGLPADRNAAIVVYCGGPGCMAWKRAADALADLGYTRISHFPGGLQEWRRAGQPLEAVSEPARSTVSRNAGGPSVERTPPENGASAPAGHQRRADHIAGCALSADAQAARIAELRSGLFGEILAVEEEDGAMRLRFADRPGTVGELTRFIRFERRCCASLRFGLSWEPQGDSVLLELRGPAAPLRALKQAVPTNR